MFILTVGERISLSTLYDWQLSVSEDVFYKANNLESVLMMEAIKLNWSLNFCFLLIKSLCN